MEATIERLTLLLSSRCNLSCAYCYQRGRAGPDAMSWEVAQASLDRLIDAGSECAYVEFSGGEPLLARELLERCIVYIRERAPADRVRIVLTTNGTLLTASLVAFLAAHDVKLQISLDGAEAAQALRGAGTLGPLERTIASIRRAHPRYFAGRLRIHAGLMPSTVGTLASSGRLFLDLGVPDVRFYPVFGRGEALPREALDILRDQMEEVAEDGARHWKRTGKIPVAFLRGKPGAPKVPSDGLCCAAGSNSGLCVDTAGRSWSCPLFASSLQPLSELARETSDMLCLGDVRDPGLQERLSNLPVKAASIPLLTRRAEKYSSYRACKNCELLGECTHCPASTAHMPGNADPHRMDDFACAFTRAASQARRGFHEKTGGAVLAAQAEEIRLALGRLADALRQDLKSRAPH